jgi:hypothetical protein
MVAGLSIGKEKFSKLKLMIKDYDYTGSVAGNVADSLLLVIHEFVLLLLRDSCEKMK